MIKYSDFKLRDNTARTKWVLIIGSTDKLGSAYAFSLARKGFNLILVSDEDTSYQLNFLKDQLSKSFQVKIEIIINNLANEQDINQLLKQIKKSTSLFLLINNFEELETNLVETKLQESKLFLDNYLTARLIEYFLQRIELEEKLFYIHTKNYLQKKDSESSFDLFLLRTFKDELRRRNLLVQILFFGAIKSKLGSKSKNSSLGALTSEKIVRKSLKNLGKKKLFCVPGLINYLSLKFKI